MTIETNILKKTEEFAELCQETFTEVAKQTQDELQRLVTEHGAEMIAAISQLIANGDNTKAVEHIFGEDFVRRVKFYELNAKALYQSDQLLALIKDAENAVS